MSKASQRNMVSSLPSTIDRFVRFVQSLERLYGLSLPVPAISSCDELGKFCSSLVEGASHPWRPIIAGLGSNARFGFSHSLFLFRKVIPKGEPQVEAYIDKMSVAQDRPDPQFLRFAEKEVRRLFRYGWDKDYRRHALTSSLPWTACAESARSAGGSRGFDGLTDADRAEFCDYVINAVAPRNRGVSVVQSILTGGKWRVIALPPRVDNALRALHHTMYDHLSRFDWLLRGDAKPSMFKRFTMVDGELFYSGDYDSATDNLNSETMKFLINSVLDRASTIPSGIREHVIQTFESDLVSRDNYSAHLAHCRKPDHSLCSGLQVYKQRRGQLMGQLVSFPLLCLINYITFRYSTHKADPKREIPVKINGDDIVFRATPTVGDKWGRDVEKGGLKLAKGKTIVHRRGFTLNSTPFWASKSTVRFVGFIRASAVWKESKPEDQISTLNSRFYSASKGFGDQRKRVVQTLFLRENSRSIHASRRSVTRGLGMSCGRGALTDSGLWFRELFYLQQPAELPLPQRTSDRVPGWVREPSWRFTSSEVRAWARLRMVACTDHKWYSTIQPNDTSSDDYFEELRAGGFPYGLPSGNKYRAMLGLSRAQCWRLANSRRDESYFGRVSFSRKGADVWVLEDRTYNGINFLGCPRFVSRDGAWAGNVVDSERTSRLPKASGTEVSSCVPGIKGWALRGLNWLFNRERCGPFVAYHA